MSEDQPKTRTASDLLLAQEGKIDTLIQMHRSLDLNLKIVSNKLNQMIELLTQADNELMNMPGNQLFPSPTPQPMQIRDQLEIPKDMPLTTETVPVGFPRTSRSETFANQPASPTPKIVPTPSLPLPQGFPPKDIVQTNNMAEGVPNKKPVSQRVVDKNGKSIYLCGVEVVDAKTNATVFKGRTNGMGKWQASLTIPNEYKVLISKQDPISKQNVNSTQTITINQHTGTELPTLICK